VVSGFLDSLAFHLKSPASRIVVLDAPLRFRAGDGRLFTVPAGFRSDLASVPGWLRWLAPPWQQSARAGVLHDCGYRWYEVWHVERAEMDRLFGLALQADGTGPWHTRALTWAVRLFGSRPWHRWRNLSVSAKGVKPGPVEFKRRAEPPDRPGRP